MTKMLTTLYLTQIVILQILIESEEKQQYLA